MLVLVCFICRVFNAAISRWSCPGIWSVCRRWVYLRQVLLLAGFQVFDCIVYPLVFFLLSLSCLGFTVSDIKWVVVLEGGSGGGGLKNPGGGGGVRLLSWTVWRCYQHTSVSQNYWTVLWLWLSWFPVVCVMRRQIPHRQRRVDRKIPKRVP